MRDAMTATAPATGGAVEVRGGARGEGCAGAQGGAADGARGGGAVGAAVSLVDQLDAVLELTPEQLDQLEEQELRDRVALLRRLEGIAVARMATTVAALDRAGAVKSDGASSMAAWMADEIGISRRAATGRARLAADLDAMPDTRAALAAGQISAEAADVVVRAGRDGRLGSPAEVEAALLPVARDEPPEHLRAEVARRTQQADGASLARDEARQHARRSVSLVPRDNGMFRLTADLTGTVGEKARTLLDAYASADPSGTDPDDRRRPDQRLADAFEAVVDVALGLGPTPTKGGVARPHLSVIVDLATFDADLTDPDDPTRPVASDDPVWSTLPTGRTAWGQTLSPQAVRKLCCDAGVSRIVMAGSSQVLDLGRATQTWSAPQRRAMAARHGACRGPHCHRPMAWTDIHHIQWWSRNGPTDMDNGLPLCSACHDLVHHHDWTVELDPVTDAATWTSPDGHTVVTHPRPPT